MRQSTAQSTPALAALRQHVNEHYLADESQCIKKLLADYPFNANAQQHIAAKARALITAVKSTQQAAGGIDAFMQEYSLSSAEGVVLMCLAESLLRIPDRKTADELIRDKMSQAHWAKHFGHSPSLFVNASTWGLILTGSIVKLDQHTTHNPIDFLGKLIARSGEPMIRGALTQAMRILAHQFVMGDNIEAALVRSQSDEQKIYLHSFDMLGEAALTQADAQRYYDAYLHAIQMLDTNVDTQLPIYRRPSISVKLSALHPRYEYSQRERIMKELPSKVLALAIAAKKAGIGLTLDAEETHRLDLSLDIFAMARMEAELADWPGFGLAVQAYQKRAPYVIDWLAELAQQTKTRIPVRLVKGAYWDSEIKQAQLLGLKEYPVYTRKPYTDLSYLACADHLLKHAEHLYPQFATHNAHTIAAILEVNKDSADFEFQRLHGMGATLYESLSKNEQKNISCRVYAPVGNHKDLLPYLVRRLLENGANTSFVHRLLDDSASIETLIADPAEKAKTLAGKRHPKIPLPVSLYGKTRRNSVGINFADEGAQMELVKAIDKISKQSWVAKPLIAGKSHEGQHISRITSPADTHREVGQAFFSDTALVDVAVSTAARNAAEWRTTKATMRAQILEKTADLLEAHKTELITLCVLEGGRCLIDAHNEVREAVDFCRYYATLARKQFANPRRLKGATGESNLLQLYGRGPFVCISPWNFPAAIFTGQIAAALAAGNTVIAKPAEQTPLTGARIIALMHDAGIPKEVLHFLPGTGELGAALVTHPNIAGVCFTGSTETARFINQTLAQREGPIVPLIAETGGQNCMIADSSALPEQLVQDVLLSAFNSAGQRCSALRVLFIQDDIADRVIQLTKEAMLELCIGDPMSLATDIGPIIDDAAKEMLEAHAQFLQKNEQHIQTCALPKNIEHGCYFAPRAYEIEKLDLLKNEVFGPILHVIRYSHDKLDAVIEAINRTGYGLTLGIHSRVQRTAEHICQRVRAGNVYVNRNMVGAVVGVQPFGGEGLSGTGPKAGGPHYLYRLATEHTLSDNISAVGGNMQLAGLDE